MAAAAGYLAAAGGVIGALGSLQQGNAASSAASYNAQIAEQNAKLAEQQSAEEERRQRVQSKKQLGDIRANVSASGITLEGSAMDVLEESAAAAELDALTIRHGGQLRSQAFRNEAFIERYSGATGKQGGLFGAASSVLSAGGKVAELKLTH